MARCFIAALCSFLACSGSGVVLQTRASKPEINLTTPQHENGTAVVSHDMLEAPLDSVGVLAISKYSCQKAHLPSVQDWGFNDTRARAIVAAWRRKVPDGIMQRDFGKDGSCHDEGTFVQSVAHLGPAPSVLTVVDNYSAGLMCPQAGQNQPRRRDLKAYSLSVSGTPLENLAPTRNFVPAWPEQCGKYNKCPVVVYLHGRDEHAKTADLDEAQKMFLLVEKWGFLRYAERDPICSKTLGSVLLFPQLLEGESWVKNGREALTHFVLPMLEQIRETHPHKVDFRRISIVGYSEGAIGALQAGVWFPDLFSFVLAAASSLPHWENVTLPDQPKKATYYRNWKLRAVVATFGHWDMDGRVDNNMIHVHHMMKWMGVSDLVPVHFRVYAGLNHVHWERVFNQWPSMNELLWKGDYDRGFGLPETKLFGRIRQYQREALEVFQKSRHVKQKRLRFHGGLAWHSSLYSRMRADEASP